MCSVSVTRYILSLPCHSWEELNVEPSYSLKQSDEKHINNPKCQQLLTSSTDFSLQRDNFVVYAFLTSNLL